MSDDSPQEPTRPEITLKVEYTDLDAFLDDFAENISHGGTTIQVGHEVMVGDNVDLNLTFPGLISPISIRGTVRWVERHGPGDEQHAGVELAQHSPELLLPTVQGIRAGDPALVTSIMRVVVVEDNAHVARLLTDGLEAYRKRSNTPLAFVTRYAANGSEALTILREHPCDALLTDMYLPVLDGEGLIRALRADEKTRQLPIVALSAGGLEARESAIASGADFFLEKPIRLSDVLAVLQKIIALK